MKNREVDPAALARKLAERAKAYRARAATRESGEASRPILTFRKGKQRYGVPLEHVLEVQSLDQFTAIPKAPMFVRGVTQWRGVILCLLDLERLFGEVEPGLADIHLFVIVEAAGRRIALVAGEIEEIYHLPSSRIQAVPELHGRVPADWLLGVFDDDCLILNIGVILQDAALVEWRQV